MGMVNLTNANARNERKFRAGVTEELSVGIEGPLGLDLDEIKMPTFKFEREVAEASIARNLTAKAGAGRCKLDEAIVNAVLVLVPRFNRCPRCSEPGGPSVVHPHQRL